MPKTVYENKGEVVINGALITGVKSLTLPRELGYAHEDDLQGGGVVQEVSGERVLRLSLGVPRDKSEFDFRAIVSSTVIIRLSKGGQFIYNDCYIKTIGEPQFTGTSAATREVEILVGNLTHRAEGSNEGQTN